MVHSLVPVEPFKTSLSRTLPGHLEISLNPTKTDTLRLLSNSGTGQHHSTEVALPNARVLLIRARGGRSTSASWWLGTTSTSTSTFWWLNSSISVRPLLAELLTEESWLLLHLCFFFKTSCNPFLKLHNTSLPSRTDSTFHDDFKPAVVWSRRISTDSGLNLDQSTH